MTTRTRNIILLACFLLQSSSFAASSSANSFRYNDNTGRRLQDATYDTLECLPDEEERLYYNIDIYVEATSQNCHEFDLVGIGELLQHLVNEVEADIPEYEETERMETVVCPLPALQQDVRKLQLLQGLVELEQRQQVEQMTATTLPPPKKKRRRKKRRYTYKGSGRCRRCKKNNSDRQLRVQHLKKAFLATTHGSIEENEKQRVDETIVSSQGRMLRRGDAVCQHAQIARDASDLVAATVSNANYALVSLEETAMTCNNLLDLNNEVAVAAVEWLDLMKQSREFASKQARRANVECVKARKQSTKKLLRKRLKRARKFANNAVKTAERTETSYVEVQDLVEAYYCDDGNIASNSTLAHWLHELSDELHERIPRELLGAYGDTTDPDGCTLEAISGYVDIEAFHEAPPDDYIESPEDCASLGL